LSPNLVELAAAYMSEMSEMSERPHWSARPGGQNHGGRDLVVNEARPMAPRPPRSGGFGGGFGGGGDFGGGRRNSY